MRRTSTVIRLAALIMTVLAVTSVCAEKYAVVVGINDYPGNSLRFCVNDARGLAEVLRARYGFAEANIHTVLDRDATRDGILSALRRHLVEVSTPGDTVVFFYSGHGTQVPDQNGDEPDGKDEAICPYDPSHNASNLIIDDEIGQIVDQLEGRRYYGFHDACHSGTGVRNLPDGFRPKYLPPELFGIQFAPNPVRSAKASDQPETLNALFDGEIAEGKSSARGFSFTHIRSRGSAETVYVAGCRPDELSSDGIVFEGTRRENGALTFHLLRALNGTAGIGGVDGVTGKQLQDYLGQQVPLGTGGGQHPQVEADAALLGQPIFAGPAGASTVTPPTENPSPPTPSPAVTTPAPASPPSGDQLVSLVTNILVFVDQALGRQAKGVVRGQAVWLAVEAETRESQPGVQVRELITWDVFDSSGEWLPERETVQILEPSPGRNCYQWRYKRPDEASDAAVLFCLQMVDIGSGRVLARVAALKRLTDRDDGLTQKQALDRVADRLAVLARVAAAFGSRNGSGGLSVSIEPREHNGLVRFSLKANRPCSAIVLDLSSSGRLALLRASQSDGVGDDEAVGALSYVVQLSGEEAALVPLEGDGFRLSGPKGDEQVVVLALPESERTGKDAADVVSAWFSAGCATAVASMRVDDGRPAVVLRRKSSGGSSVSPSTSAHPSEQELDQLFR